MCSTFIQEVFVYPQVVVSILTLLDGVLQELFFCIINTVYDMCTVYIYVNFTTVFSIQ